MLEFNMRRIQLVILCSFLPLLVACNTNTDGELNKAALTDNPSAISILESKEYQIQEHFQISNHGPGMPSKHNLWVALISDQPPYQEVLEMS
ncbi:MAG: hypothetical protein WBB55_14810, partial [Anaerolineales bacterium]